MRPLTDRLSPAVLTEFLVSAIKLLAVLLLASAAADLGRQPGRWPALGSALWVAAAMVAVGAIAPWVLVRLSLRVSRLLTWGALLLASGILTAAMVVIGLEGLAGAQLLLAAAVLSEIRHRQHALRWLCWTTAALAATVWLYYLLPSPNVVRASLAAGASPAPPQAAAPQSPSPSPAVTGLHVLCPVEGGGYAHLLLTADTYYKAVTPEEEARLTALLGPPVTNVDPGELPPKSPTSVTDALEQLAS
ncbi:MAG: hypothetical protein ACRDYX_17745 [Egibacteraceae bacterium]